MASPVGSQLLRAPARCQQRLVAMVAHTKAAKKAPLPKPSLLSKSKAALSPPIPKPRPKQRRQLGSQLKAKSKAKSPPGQPRSPFPTPMPPPAKAKHIDTPQLAIRKPPPYKPPPRCVVVRRGTPPGWFPVDPPPPPYLVPFLRGHPPKLCLSPLPLRPALDLVARPQCCGQTQPGQIS